MSEPNMLDPTPELPDDTPIGDVELMALGRWVKSQPDLPISRITVAQKSEWRLQVRPESAPEPRRRERDFWTQRRNAKNGHSNELTPAETKSRELSGRKSPQKRPI